jgi:hemolysin III
MVDADGRPLRMSPTYDRAEIIADGVVHAIGVGLGLIGAIVIVVLALHPPRSIDLPSVLVYAIALLSMLGLSAAYNVWPVSRVKWMLRRFDHSAIYVMIGGTYTPLVAQLKSGVWSAGLMIGVWSAAALGIALKLLLPGRFERLSVILYLLLGWCGVIAWRPVVASLPGSTLWLLAVGGALYSTGVAFHAWRTLRFHNAIWHGFVLIAAGCHYAAILACMLRT